MSVAADIKMCRPVIRFDSFRRESPIALEDGVKSELHGG